MFLAEFMLGTLAFAFRENLARSMKEELLYGIEKHYNITREPGTLSTMWDHIHTEVGTHLNRSTSFIQVIEYKDLHHVTRNAYSSILRSIISSISLR